MNHSPPGDCPGDCDVLELVGRARDGDQNAWTVLYERFKPKICRILESRFFGVVSAADIEEAYQDGLRRSVERFSESPESGKDSTFEGLLLTISRNICFDLLRTRLRGPREVPASEIPDGVVPNDGLVRRLIDDYYGSVLTMHEYEIHRAHVVDGVDWKYLGGDKMRSRIGMKLSRARRRGQADDLMRRLL